MQVDKGSIEAHLPFYLSQEQKGHLAKALEDFRREDRSPEFISGQQHQDLLQGDGFQGFSIYDFELSQQRNVRGIIFSNTCDIDPGNPRHLPPRITFAPLIRFQTFLQLLEAEGLSGQAVESKIASIRKQEITNIFYIPSTPLNQDEYIVPLDDVHSMPLSVFLESGSRNKLFSLSMFGFYLFVLKLSVHFCRLHEGVQR